MAQPAPTPPEPKGPLPKILKLLAWLAAPATTTLVAPWILPLFRLNLYPEYYQLAANPFASISFLASFLIAAATYRRTSQKRMRNHLTAWLVVFLFCLLCCIWLSNNLSVTWEPGPFLTSVVYVLWFLAFLLTFGTFAMFLVLAGYLLLGNDA